MLQSVTIVFKNGVTQTFVTEDFDLQLTEPDSYDRPYKYKFTYKHDDFTQEVPMFLALNEVAGIVVASM